MENENKIEDGGPAYPETIAGTMDGIYSAKDEGHSTGMTLRAYFAAAAMQGLISNPDIEDLSCAEVASDSVMYADALIKRLGE